MASLNLNTAQKTYFTVTFGDLSLMVYTPTKSTLDFLTSMESSIDELGEDPNNITALENMYEACSRILSRNKAGIHVTQKELEEQLDLEDLILIFNSYLDFVNTVVNSKN